MLTENLLEQAQSQAQELRSRQEELRSSNEDLGRQASRLAEQNSEMERKNQEVEPPSTWSRRRPSSSPSCRSTSRSSSRTCRTSCARRSTACSSSRGAPGQRRGEPDRGAGAVRQAIHSSGTDLLGAQRHPRPREGRVGHGQLESGSRWESCGTPSSATSARSPSRRAWCSPSSSARRPADDRHRPRPAAPGAQEPALERLQVHRGRRGERAVTRAQSGCTVRTRRSRGRRGDRVHVSDTGIGIPEESSSSSSRPSPRPTARRPAIRRHRAWASRSAASWCGCSAARSRWQHAGRGQHVHRVPPVGLRAVRRRGAAGAAGSARGAGAAAPPPAWRRAGRHAGAGRSTTTSATSSR